MSTHRRHARFQALLATGAPAIFDFTTGVLDRRISFSRAGQATYVDPLGLITYAPNNLLLNSAALSTQTAAVFGGVAYILSFTGTGSVVASGASAFTLAGNGSRVHQLFTPAASGNLTLTVSGIVTLAMLEAVTYQISPRDYIATTSAAYFGPRWQDGGLLVESSATNHLLRGTNLSQSWLVDGATNTASPAIGPDGRMTARRITETTTTNRHIVYQQASSASSRRFTASICVRQVTARYCSLMLARGGASFFSLYFDLQTGEVTSQQSLAPDVVLSARAISLGDGWFLLQVVGEFALAQSNVYFVFALSQTPTPPASLSFGNPVYAGTGLSVDVSHAQLEVGDIATSAIPTGANAVARAPDVGSFIVPSDWQNALYTYADATTQIVPVTAGASHTILQSPIPLAKIERAA